MSVELAHARSSSDVVTELTASGQSSFYAYNDHSKACIMTVGKSHTEAGSAAFAGSTKQDFGTKNTSSFPPADTTTGKTVQEEMGITGGNDFSLRGGTKAEYKGEESTIPNPESAAEGEPLSTAGRSGDKIKDSVKGHDVRSSCCCCQELSADHTRAGRWHEDWRAHRRAEGLPRDRPQARSCAASGSRRILSHSHAPQVKCTYIPLVMKAIYSPSTAMMAFLAARTSVSSWSSVMMSGGATSK